MALFKKQICPNCQSPKAFTASFKYPTMFKRYWPCPNCGKIIGYKLWFIILGPLVAATSPSWLPTLLRNKMALNFATSMVISLFAAILLIVAIYLTARVIKVVDKIPPESLEKYQEKIKNNFT